MAIRRVIDAVFHRDIRDGKRVHTFQAADVEAVLLRVGSALVMRVDAADAAEVVPRRVRVELVELQMLFALDNAQPCQRHGGHHGALAPADGAVAATRFLDAVGKG